MENCREYILLSSIFDHGSTTSGALQRISPDSKGKRMVHGRYMIASIRNRNW
jgi:hypothetical protein